MMGPAHRLACVFLLWVACTAPALAITWGEKTITDPIDGSSCTVPTPRSAGSYIYQYPEKYEQVFFPVTSAEGLWSCGSGFTSLIGDVELTEGERAKVSTYLAGLPALERTAATLPARLRRMEAIYAVRELPEDKRIVVLRVLAFQYETLLADAGSASARRDQALRMMLAALANEDMPAGKRMEYLFVSANYLREQGNPERADRLQATLEQELDAAQGTEQAGYADYLRALLPEARRIAPGGRLAPDSGM